MANSRETVFTNINKILDKIDEKRGEYTSVKSLEKQL